ncbi:HutD family protein [Paraburkholderia bryophila]|uniref:HutD/Ves family protein n=1 Tax=Paraburkholderia bryophila TaxID=420952 RepID=UPI00234A6482|nr:HutD family protein [Paraburkholderia bryophila]WCM21111.1 HutD family protein [Paraburkholderia bryophila]
MTDVGSMASVTLIRGADLVAAPWKNGGGVTREVAAVPEQAGLDSFVWRVSIADVAQAGPFSRFAGIDRTLVLLSGAGMMLDEIAEPENGLADEAVKAASSGVAKTHALTQPLDIARFAGETAIDARLVDGATRDFNLMVRRGAARGEVEVWRGTTQHALSADVVLLYCAEGAVSVSLGDAAAQPLATGDTLRVNAPDALHCAVQGAGALLAIRLHYER